jgi:hypothetical protein
MQGFRNSDATSDVVYGGNIDISGASNLGRSGEQSGASSGEVGISGGGFAKQ